jgi:hypothetical protein
MSGDYYFLGHISLDEWCAKIFRRNIMLPADKDLCLSLLQRHSRAMNH